MVFQLVAGKVELRDALIAFEHFSDEGCPLGCQSIPCKIEVVKTLVASNALVKQLSSFWPDAAIGQVQNFEKMICPEALPNRCPSRHRCGRGQRSLPAQDIRNVQLHPTQIQRTNDAHSGHRLSCQSLPLFLRCSVQVTQAKHRPNRIHVSWVPFVGLLKMLKDNARILVATSLPLPDTCMKERTFHLSLVSEGQMFWGNFPCASFPDFFQQSHGGQQLLP
mmetsp:Transcript_41290/g.101362  ORF Transcript_41290/g.101362 Transcript_41290/m.101362 type:complete len:221 (+) Transcript_41290:1445-2107(+)